MMNNTSNDAVIQRLEMLRDGLWNWLRRNGWNRHQIGSPEEMGRLVGALSDAMSKVGYAEHDILGIGLTLERVIEHALRTAEQAPGGPGRVGVNYHVDDERVLIEVEDPAAEEELSKLLGPLADTAGEGESAPLVVGTMIWIRYHSRHNKFLMLSRHRSCY